MMMAQALLGNIADSRRKLIASVTSKMGSISDNTSGGSYAYRASKTALNSAMHSLAPALQEVKQLSEQTAKATDEIGEQVGGVQSSTGNAVQAIRSITESINEVTELASAMGDSACPPV